MNFQVSILVNLSKAIIIASTLIFSHIVEASALLSDDFNATTSEPNPTWRFHDPYDITGGNDTGESTLTFNGTNALINIPDGLAHDLWKTSNSNKAPRLLQSAPNTDFKFEVKFETEPNVKHQMQGVIVQQSDNIFLRFDVFYNISGWHLFVAYIDGTTNSDTTYKSIALPNSPNYRQVIRSGDDWTFRYSDDGTTWTDAVTFNQSLTVSEVGFFAGTAGINPSFLSSVDYFIDLDEPIIDNDTWTPPPIDNVPPPVINAWNGYAQPTVPFGQLGIPQKWANILGNISSDIYLSSLSYSINGDSEEVLNFGPDNRRLEEKGDFNIEIDTASLNDGLNTVEIKAKDSHNQITSKVLTIDFDSGNSWPLPFTADWGALATIQDVESISHIVDGLWNLTADGIRTIQTGYDRTIAIGDESWPSDNYEVTVPFTLHSSFSGIGFAVGWQGHEGTRLPRTEWPVQALAWIRSSSSLPSLNIVTYGGLINGEVTEATQQLASLSVNETYILKSFSEPLSAGMSRFYVKFWKQSDDEPMAWNLQADIPTRDGSVLLIAYNADATFGNVSVKQPGSADTTPPVISNIQVAKTNSTATISWNTDEPSNSRVDYGLNSSYGLNVNDAAQITTHSLTLTGLNSNTTYHYRVKSSDSSNNTGSSGDLVFTLNPNPPKDTIPPVISNINVAVTNTSATITWNTDEPSTSIVNYGLDSNFGLKANDSAKTTVHSLTLTNLNSSTDHHFQVKSVDSSNNMVTSDNICLSQPSGICKLKTSAVISAESMECLLNWAEQQYPDVFSPSLASSQPYEDYIYRYYSDTNIYLGFFQGKKVHYLEANKTDGIVDAGDVEYYQNLAGCL